MSDDERKEALQDLMLAQADVFYRPKDISIDSAIEALKNQISIVEELEKIKAEIDEIVEREMKGMGKKNEGLS